MNVIQRLFWKLDAIKNTVQIEWKYVICWVKFIRKNKTVIPMDMTFDLPIGMSECKACDAQLNDIPMNNTTNCIHDERCSWNVHIAVMQNGF